MADKAMTNKTIGNGIAKNALSWKTYRNVLLFYVLGTCSVLGVSYMSYLVLFHFRAVVGLADKDQPIVLLGCIMFWTLMLGIAIAIKRKSGKVH